MPIHFRDVDVTSELGGVSSALIVPCNMCPAVTVAVREERPFMQLFRSFLKSAPFEQYIAAMRSRLREKGVSSRVFRSNIPHQWFMCMWTARQRKKLQTQAKQYDAIIVVGCESATATVRDVVESTDCKLIEAMRVSGITNAKLRLHWPCNVSFEDCKTIPISQDDKEGESKPEEPDAH